MLGLLPLTPAYGRNPLSRKEAQASLDANRDWRASNGQYINRPQLLELLGAGRKIETRSADLRKCWILTL